MEFTNSLNVTEGGVFVTSFAIPCHLIRWYIFELLDMSIVTFEVMEGLGKSRSDVQFLIPEFKLVFTPLVFIISVFKL